MQGFGDRSVMQEIGDLFQLHPLLLEDVVNLPQRPKTESYGDQVLIIVRMVQVHESGEIDLEQVSIVLGKNYVLTFQEKHGDILDPVRRRIRSKTSTIRHQAADFLAYAIADTIIDAYYPALEVLGDQIEELEDDVISDPTPELLRELNRMKNRLVNLRRSIWPQREAINRMVRGDYPAISENVRIYLRDTYDHCVQTSEVAEMYREMVTGLMNTYLSSIANRTNEVMKVLTIMASIFIPLTFLAGIYGMNFKHMPELQMEWAYPTVWILMLLTAGGMLFYFWKKGWIDIGQGDDEEKANSETSSEVV
ncbi:MAG: magnesium/cobalt transporter CorA [Planctomycetaceae bacterium]